MRLDGSNLAALARGCEVLGAGGGGDASLGLLMALHAVEGHGPATVVDAGDLPADALVMPCGQLGSPAVASERPWSGDEGRVLREAVQRRRGEPVRAFMPFAIAGVNGLLAVLWAARTGLPLIDADGTGRSFPDVRQQAMHLGGVPASPVVLTEGRGDVLVLDAADDDDAARIAHGVTTGLGGVCAAALACMTAAEARRTAIQGSISRAVAIGAAIADDGIVGALDASVLLSGKVVDVERRLDAAGGRSSAIVAALGDGTARQLRLELQDEYLLALEDGAVRAAVPDLILVLARESGAIVPTDQLRYGQNVSVVAAPGPQVWRSAAGLALVGPRAFGYTVDHVALDAHAGR